MFDVKKKSKKEKFLRPLPNKFARLLYKTYTKTPFHSNGNGIGGFGVYYRYSYSFTKFTYRCQENHSSGMRYS